MLLPFTKPRGSFITCCGRDDGGCAQISAQISTMIFASLRGLTYAHTPLEDIAHRPQDLDPAAWASRWENFFHLGLGETLAADLDQSALRHAHISKPHRFLPRSGRFYQVAHCHKVTNRKPAAWAEIAPAIRKKYLSTPKPDIPPEESGTISIGIHIRRGDVDAVGRFAERFTPTTRILEVVQKLNSICGPERCRIHLFSEGSPDDFSEFSRLNTVFHLDEDPFQSFHHMTKVDVLVLAKSTFSYLAGVLGGGLVLFEPFWHPPLPQSWLPLDSDDETLSGAIGSIESQRANRMSK